MKNFLILAILFFSLNVSSNELTWVDEQIKAIKPSRSGLNNSSISSMKDPFIFLKKYKKELLESKTNKTSLNKISSNDINIADIKAKKSKKLSLTALMNKSALINERWYTEGEMVNGYKLSEVNRKSILLTKKSKKLILSTRSINKNLNFKNK